MKNFQVFKYSDQNTFSRALCPLRNSVLGHGKQTSISSLRPITTTTTIGVHHRRRHHQFQKIKGCGVGKQKALNGDSLRKGLGEATVLEGERSCGGDVSVAVKAVVTLLVVDGGGRGGGFPASNGVGDGVESNGAKSRRIAPESLAETLSLELVSSELSPETVRGQACKMEQQGEKVKLDLRFQVPWTFGEIGAVTVESKRDHPIFLDNIQLDCFHKGPLTIKCNTWVQSTNQKLIFFTDKGFFKKKVRIGDGYRISASSKHLVFAYYVTGHGFGHATRVVEQVINGYVRVLVLDQVARHLISAGHDVHVVTGAPEFVFTSVIQSPQLFIRKVLLDCGAVQADALTVDRVGSLEKYSQVAVAPRASILTTEAKWLNSIKADLVISDVVPVACRAAEDAGIPSVCVSNFSWDFIYSEYVMTAGYRHRSLIWQIAEDYSHCKFLIRLPGHCPTPAFHDVIDVPLIVRRLHKSRNKVRQELGIGNDVKLVIFNFGGHPAGWKLEKEYLPDGWLCLVCGAKENQKLPSNFVKLPKDVYTPDMIAASDCMIGKIGYGTVSEALAYKIPFVFIHREYFNEEPFLRNMLECYQGGIEMPIKDMLSGNWAPFLQHAINLKPCYEGATNGGQVAARVIQDIAIAENYAPPDKNNYPFILPEIHN